MLVEQEGRRKRQRVDKGAEKEKGSEKDRPSIPSERQAAKAAEKAAKEAKAAKAAEVDEGEEEEEIGCFCHTDRHMPTNDIPFEVSTCTCSYARMTSHPVVGTCTSSHARGHMHMATCTNSSHLH